MAYRDDPIEGQGQCKQSASSLMLLVLMNFSLDGTRKVETWSRNPLKIGVALKFYGRRVKI